ncbi:PP2C family protein-serine/threonine phosphatase [Tautonia plasticadhaerens]|uniref:PP2C-family Ser/Thr phosphatase n=1 Tax=Tautonia plasticadhaerens TaxID=2527974 RepID=A0A518GY62_9BACT|nr:protein phosphatase 2C domain-containing protein [Tautonia plasticadhaerens]QDV33527.1 PP2C-family Ser/Thr phosphatase [Tautonia plasticadhaerens]
MPVIDFDEPSSPIEDSTIEYPATAERPLLRVRTRCEGLTDRGLRRENNEDNFLIARLTKRLDVCRSSFEHAGRSRFAEEIAHLLVVADGLGGAAAGERASELSISTIEDFVLNCFKWFLHFEPGEKDELVRELRDALRRADHDVYQKARDDRSLMGMGTTLTMAYSVFGQLYIAHAGDSRAYLLRGGTLRRLTRDHTYAQMLLDAGEISPEDARRPGLRNVVTNVVGGPNEGVYVELHKLDLEDGDALLLCTDGLTEPVTEEDIAADLSRFDDPGGACRSLVERALKAGGPDNVAVVVARFALDRG